MKTILFPTDFTAATHNALEWAKLFARQHNATLVLLHVYQIPLPDTTLPTMGNLGVGAMVSTDLEQMSRESLEKLATQLKSEGFKVEIDWRLGNVEDEVVRAAHERDVDLIVTGRSDLTGFFDWLVGSPAMDVVREANCPVLVVPNLTDAKASIPAQVNQITYASQLEFDERESMRQVLVVAKTFGAALHLVKVDADNQLNLYDDGQFMVQLQRFHPDLSLDTVQARSVTSGLKDYLSKHPTDLLVMTTRERGFLANLINPSETERMVAHSEVPVLVLHG